MGVTSPDVDDELVVVVDVDRDRGTQFLTAGHFFGQRVRDLFELGITVAVYDVVHPDIMRCRGLVWGASRPLGFHGAPLSGAMGTPGHSST